MLRLNIINFFFRFFYVNYKYVSLRWLHHLNISLNVSIFGYIIWFLCLNYYSSVFVLIWLQNRCELSVTSLHCGIWEELILLYVGRPASYDTGIRWKPLGSFLPNPLSLVLTWGGSGEPPTGSHDAERRSLLDSYPKFSSWIPLCLLDFGPLWILNYWS